MQKIQLVAALVSIAPLFPCLGCAERSALLVDDDPHASSKVAAAPQCSGAPLGRPLVVANYNIKSGMFTTLDKVGATLDDMHADVVALEEVDDAMDRTGGVDQSEVLAKRLGMERIFAGTMDRGGGTYGIALLSKFPILHASRYDLPDHVSFEPRAAADTLVCAGDTPVRVVWMHADVFPWAAKAHVLDLAHYLAKAPVKNTIVLGDFNTTIDNDAVKPLVDAGYVDALHAFDEKPTFPGTKQRIDYIMTDIKLTGAKVGTSTASDHYPVSATLELPSTAVAALAPPAPAG